MSPFTGLQVPALYLTSTSIENVSAKKKKKKERNVKNPQETNWKPSPDDSQKKKKKRPTNCQLMDQPDGCAKIERARTKYGEK